MSYTLIDNDTGKDIIETLRLKNEEIERLTENNLSMQGEMARTWKKAEEKDKEIERLKTNLEVANEDLTRIAKLLNLEEGCTIYDIVDKIKELKECDKE